MSSRSHMGTALDTIDWSKRIPVLEYEGWKLILHEGVTYGAFYVIDRHVIMQEKTWIVLGYKPELIVNLLGGMSEGARGLRFLSMDSGPYGEAARAAAEALGSDSVMAKDAITQAMEEANRLIVQAAGINQQPTPVQRQIFAIRLAQLEESYQALEMQFSQLRGLIDLAGTAVADVTS